MRNSLVMIVLVAVMLGVGASVMAGEIDPGLENILKSAGPEQVISVLIYLDDQVNLYAITGEMDNRDTSLRRYHEVVVRALQEKVLTTQGDIVAFLSELKGEGKVKGFETYWITNAIRAEAVKEAVEKIAARADVAKVYYNYEAELVEPVEIMGDTRGGISSVENGVEAIRAPEVWALGIDGRGVLVANIDTGVDGHHPALAGRWAGVADPRYAGHPEWAWFDPYSNQNDFPFDQNGHGTHTMGTLTGADPVDGDTIGVVPGSFWIASAPLNRGGTIPETIADIILCMQWMIDPDGNPSTNWDVPAICSNSWGFSPYHGIPPCDSLFWAPIDACEAAGIVMLFSVGADQLVVNPASRATDDYRNCSIGAVDANQPGWPIAYFSARGPSYCTPDGSPAIKPEFVAPGVNIRSSVPGGGYAYYSGVSMACPHGAGVVALIKQVNPNLTPDEIKQIIYDTAYDLGPPGEDNSYGWGMVDAYEAVQLAWSQLPPVSIDMIPDNAPIVVQLGHSFTFTGILSNNSDSSQIGDVWIMLDVPEYGVYGPIKRYDNVALASHHTITVPGITQYVPYYAPVGLYNYIAYCGDFPSVVVDSASFEFDAVTPSAGGADEWSLSGWFADDLSNIPSKMALFANHPNPFNATTTISFRLPEKMAATVEIFNLLGEKVIILAEGVLDAGSHNITWDASNYSSGIYLCKFSTPAESKTLRMVLLK